jgi:hypothetical protein
MCTGLLPPGGYPTAVNKYIISYIVCLVQELRRDEVKVLNYFGISVESFEETLR